MRLRLNFCAPVFGLFLVFSFRLLFTEYDIQSLPLSVSVALDWFPNLCNTREHTLPAENAYLIKSNSQSHIQVSHVQSQVLKLFDDIYVW